MNNCNTILKMAISYQKLCLAEQFDIKQLDAEPTPSSKMRYCNRHLPLIGRGGSRLAYRLSSKKALKIATESTGVVQNQNEATILTSVQSKLLPKFYKAAPDYSWIEVELVRPIYGWAEFEQLSGLDPSEFVTMMKSWRVYNFTVQELKGKYADNKFFKSLTKLIDTVGIDEQELLTKQNFGKNSDGQLVVLDVGFLFDSNE